MSDEERLVMRVADIILEVVDAADELTRSDLQGFADVQAREILNEVRAS